MNLDPTLRGADRVMNLVAGIALVVLAVAGGLDRVWLQVGVGVIGVALVVGGIGGT